MNTSRARNILAMFILFWAYMLLLLEWMWIFIISVPQLIEKGSFDGLFMESTDTLPVVPTLTIEPSPFIWVVAGIITVVMIIVTILVIVRTPRAVARGSHELLHKGVKTAMPIVTHHRPLAPAERRVLSKRLELAFQLILCVVPIVICFTIPPFKVLTSQIIMTVAVSLAAGAAVGFVLAFFVKPVVTSRTQSHESHE